jgi:acetolactate synthase-1/2/3 large subunit
VVIDLPKDILMGQAPYRRRADVRHRTYNPKVEPQVDEIDRAVQLMAKARRPVFYVGGGVINAGPQASAALAELVRETGFPITLTLMGLGAYPGSDPQFLGMLGMHGTLEANLAMHGCDLMIAIGARFDDRVTGRLDSFSPGSTKIHIDIDPSSINKNVPVDVPIVADAGRAIEALLGRWRARKLKPKAEQLKPWWDQIAAWRAKDSLRYRQNGKIIKPQYAIQRLWALTRDRETYITTEVGQARWATASRRRSACRWRIRGRWSSTLPARRPGS